MQASGENRRPRSRANAVGNIKHIKLYERIFITENNYDVSVYEQVIDHPNYAYAVVGREVSPSGTPHFHLYAVLKTPMSFRELKDIYPRAYIQHAKGNHKQAIEYCSKDGDWKESGQRPI